MVGSFVTLFIDILFLSIMHARLIYTLTVFKGSASEFHNRTAANVMLIEY